jgi:hypothetical protein
VRSKGCEQLKRLDEFTDAILVSGCQRSGTTMLSRIITQSKGMVNYWFGPDDELDAALILSGYVDHEPQGRYCFQTTYLDECYREYFEHSGDFQIVWVLRNPYSVVYSLLYNWPARALDGTFSKYGAELLTGIDKWGYRLFGIQSVSRPRRACLLYNAKVSQVFELKRKFGPEKLMLVDYDNLVTHKELILQKIYRFVDLDYEAEYADKIHAQSLDKRKRLQTNEIAMIEGLSVTLYQNALHLIDTVDLD